MHTDSGMWGWWPLTAPLHLAPINPLDMPQLKAKGCHVGRVATSRACDTAEEGASGANSTSTSLTAGAESPGATSLESWVGSLEMVADGIWWHFLGGGGMENTGEWDMALIKSLYKPSTSDPAIADSILHNPSVSSCWACSFNAFALFSKSRPWMKKWGLSERSN